MRSNRPALKEFQQNPKPNTWVLAKRRNAIRHADIRTTMNVYGDIVTDEMSEAASKVAGLALNGAQTERK
jgi:hypothetical protein